MTTTEQPAAAVAVPVAAIDATASRALDAAHADLSAARAAAGRAFDVDWVSRAANAYGARLDDITSLLDGVSRLIDAAVGSARHAEAVARSGLPPQCVAGGTWGASVTPGGSLSSGAGVG